MTVYNEIPYGHLAHSFTRPEYIQAVCRVLGHEAPDYKQCRVLDIGCATGGNLFPLALNYPGCKFVGLDLAAEQIRTAESIKQELGIDNVEFHACSVEDLDESFGGFDYIFGHGFITWVPRPVVDETLKRIKQRLTPKGVAMLSYNTYPGWHMVHHIRESMRYHVRHIEDHQKRVAQALSWLDFMASSFEKRKSPLAEIYKNELATLRQMPVSYLIHDHLGEFNTPFSISEFADMVDSYGLAYVSDTNMMQFQDHQFSPREQAQLRQVNDYVAREQYKDWILNRRFRRSLIVHKDCAQDWALKPEALRDYAFVRNNNWKVETNAEITGPESFKPGLKFTVQVTGPKQDKSSRINVEMPSREAAAAFHRVSFAQSFRPIALRDMAADIARDFGQNQELVLQKLFKVALDFWIVGFWNGHLDTSPDFVEVSESPKLHRYNQICWRRGLNMASPLHFNIQKSPILELLMPLLDGQHRREDFVKAVNAALDSGQLARETYEELLKETACEGVEEAVEDCLGYLERRLMFVS